ncbi:MAG: iron-sulfur cluster assembly protein [Candidatus Ranarchaeia archaeon]
MELETILKRLETVYDPEHPISVLELRIVQASDIKIEGNRIHVDFTPTTPFCPMGAVIGVVIKKVIKELYPDAEITVNVKPGTHVREEAVNQMINDSEQYDQTLERLETTGLLEQCIG